MPNKDKLSDTEQTSSEYQENMDNLILEADRLIDDLPTSRSKDYGEALNKLSIALHAHITYKGKNLPLLDHAWYALEIADRVLEGDTMEEALDKFLNSDTPPKRWEKHGKG